MAKLDTILTSGKLGQHQLGVNMRASRQTLEKAFLIALLGEFSQACFGLTRFQKLVFLSQRKCGQVVFPFVRWHYGPYSEEVSKAANALEDAGAVEGQSKVCPALTASSKRLLDTSRMILKLALPGCMEAVAETVQSHGYEKWETIREFVYSLPEVRDATPAQVLMHPTVEDSVDIDIDPDILEEFQLLTNADFVAPLESLAAALDGIQGYSEEIEKLVNAA